MADWGLNQPPAEPGMRIGLFGGSFNPAHEGHRLVALQCLKRLALDRVWLLVSPGNPLKDLSDLTPVEERVRDTALAMSHPQLDVTGFEARRGFRYTWQTVRHLAGAEPGVRFVWIMGADSLAGFHHWERWQDIAARLPMAIYARPGSALQAPRCRAAVALEDYRIPEAAAATLAERPPPAWVFLRGVMSGQSSSTIRQSRSKTI